MNEIYKEKLSKIRTGEIKLKGFPYIDIIYYTLNEFPKDKEDSKKVAGTINELLIAGKLYKKGYKVLVTNDNNRDYDIIIEKNRKRNVVECKLDNTAHIHNNFFFEYWNYTFNRPTGINNSDLNTIYAHTYYNKEKGKYYLLIGKRRLFIEAIQNILSKEPNDIKGYEHSYYTYKGITGDKAYIVKKDTFIKYFKGYHSELEPSFRWK